MLIFKKTMIGILLFSVLAFLTIFLWKSSEGERTQPVFFPRCYSDRTLVIDAGHGGEDGGAIAKNEVPESGINLSIAEKLDQIMGLYGIQAVMTRTEDISLHAPGSDTIREKKISDLHNRTEFINSQENAVLISIHQNTFPSGKYKGAHVFYADSGNGSMEFAVSAQEILRFALDPENSRKAAIAPNSVYLMKHVTCPAILVECGFLSNDGESALLQDRSYQTKIAMALTSAFLTSGKF